MIIFKIFISCFLALFQISEFTKSVEMYNDTSSLAENVLQVSENFDSKEPHNTYDSATNLCPENYYELDQYESELDAVLYVSGTSCDYDIFYFTILVDSSVHISVTANQVNYSFDMIIVKNVYQENISDDAYHDPVNIHENGTTESIKSFSDVLEPGTYYIVLLNQSPFDYDNVVNYHLKLSVEKKNNYSSASIQDLIYNKQLLGALWKSDYVPIHNQFNFESKTHTYYQKSSSLLSIPDYTLDSMMSISNCSPVHYATLYIFDPILVVLSAIAIIEEKINGIEEAKVRYEFALDTIHKTISVVGYVTSATATILGASTTVCLLIPTIEFTLESFFQQLFSIITPAGKFK